ncbi:hypothetical protein ACH5RR_009699 [Cinchona calisaya]|uniref:Peroxidase n=1 Tax=Cinchona calisaya TaxID=153742 RepID=A0ABD3AHG6_9GENT
MSKAAAATLALVAFVSMIFIGQCNAALRIGFYKGKCQSIDVETTVFNVIKSKFKNDSTITAALLRLQFHDCFVTGCDASLLLDGKHSEKTAFPNLSVRGYEIIDAAKAAIEETCPDVVSCADIIAMATRDAVSLSGGGRYEVQTGRRDGNASSSANVFLPGPSDSISDAIDIFATKGLNSTDMVFLLGAHTVGVAHCSFVQDRLYNFQNTGKPDPSMDTKLVSKLRRTCPQDSGFNKTVNLDQNPLSSMTLDNSYYKQIISHKGILEIDQNLALDPLTKDKVNSIANSSDFSSKFGQVMVKLGALDVLTGNQGEIRRSCQKVN